MYIYKIKTMKKSSYSFSSISNDLPAALVVFLVALPLCLGVALASGAPLFSGIIAGVVGGIVIGLLSGSSLSVSGPAAGLTVIVFNSIQQTGTFEIFLSAVVICGILQIVAGMLKAGVVAEFIPNSVIRGMLSAIGIILILKQIPHAVGYDKDYEGDFSFWQKDGQNTFSELGRFFSEGISQGAALIAFASLAFLFVWESKKIKSNPVLKLIPGALIVVLFGVLANEIFFANTSLQILDEHKVNIPVAADFGAFLGQFRFPDFSHLLSSEVWIVAGTLAIVASLETLLSLEAIDKLDPQKRTSPPNRELLAQGVGNMVSGFLGGLPVTSVIVRSSANVNSGGQSRWAAVFHGVLLLVCVYALPQWLNKIPLSSLAAVLLFTGFKLAHPSVFKREWRDGLTHFIPFVVTIAAIVFTDLLEGIIIGIAIGALFVSFANYHTAVAVVQNGLDYRITIEKDLSFANKATLKKVFSKIEDGANVVFDASKAAFIDLDNVEIINDFIESTRYRNIKVEVIRTEKKLLTEIKNI